MEPCYMSRVRSIKRTRNSHLTFGQGWSQTAQHWSVLCKLMLGPQWTSTSFIAVPTASTKGWSKASGEFNAYYNGSGVNGLCPIASCTPCGLGQYTSGCGNGNAGTCTACPGPQAGYVWVIVGGFFASNCSQVMIPYQLPSCSGKLPCCSCQFPCCSS